MHLRFRAFNKLHSQTSETYDICQSQFQSAIEPPTTRTKMFPQRQMLRTTQRFAANLRSPAVRTPFQRRFASHAESGLKGVEDNAFNRERQAVKAHAAATSGTSRCFPLRFARCANELEISGANCQSSTNLPQTNQRTTLREKIESGIEADGRIVRLCHA
jgi:hypothetical protein